MMRGSGYEEIFRDTKGRFAGEGAYESKAPGLRTGFTPLMQAQSFLEEAFETADSVLSNAEASEGKVPAVVVRASPGAGKSCTQRAHMSRKAAGGTIESVAFHVPTLALAEEAATDAANLGLNAVALRGRQAKRPDGTGTMCAKAQTVAKAIRLGLSVRDSFCEMKNGEGAVRRCLHFQSCAYLKQFEVDATHRFLATSYLNLPTPGGEKTALRVVDETFWREFLWIRDVNVTEFCAPRTYLRASKAAEHADLLKAAKDVCGELIAGRSPLSLSYSADGYAKFADLELEARSPDVNIMPDQSDTVQSAKLAKAELEYRQVMRFSALWKVLSNAKENGLATTERLSLVSENGRQMIRIFRKRPLRHAEPMLLLDADADEEVLSAIGCDVRAVHNLALRPNAEVHQLSDRQMTKGSLLSKPGLREDWRRIIAREVLQDQLSRNAGVLVGATLKVVRAFFEDAGQTFEGWTDEQVAQHMLETKLHGANWTWFGSRSLGSNRYAKCSTVIIIGREELPLHVLEEQGRALFGDTRGRDLQLLASGQDKEARLPRVEAQYEMKDGSAMAVMIPAHPDPLIRRLQMQSRELATRQLIERLRLARSDYPKRVLLGSNIPIPGLPIDTLLSWEELCCDRLGAAVTDGLLQEGGVRLSAAGLHEAAPRVFNSLNASKKFLSRYRSASGLLERLVARHPSGALYAFRMRRAALHAREEIVLVVAADFELACAHVGTLWGPLKNLSPMPTHAFAKEAA